MSFPVLIITYKRFDLVLEILGRLAENGLKEVYFSIDDFYKDDSFSKVEEYLRQEQFRFRLFKWDKNVGCDINVTEGIRWFFEQVDRGIILEDDCVPTAAFGSILSALQEQELKDRVVSLFSPLTGPSCTYREALLPFFWGWYCSRDFYSRFYEFYRRPAKNPFYITNVFSKSISLKLKLITLMNFYSHKALEKGTAWDSELFYFMLISNERMLVPPASYIHNKGFGDLDAVYTHTHSLPDWYRSVVFADLASDCGDLKVSGEQQQFLEVFYAGYTNNLAKLFGTFLKSYLRYLSGSGNKQDASNRLIAADEVDRSLA